MTPQEELRTANQKLKLATDALTMIAKYAPSRPARELDLAPEADASWAQQAGSIAKQTLEAMAKVEAKPVGDSNEQATTQN